MIWFRYKLCRPATFYLNYGEMLFRGSLNFVNSPVWFIKEGKNSCEQR